MIVKKLVKHGNSRALVIDRPILEVLGFTDETPLAITTDGKCLFIARSGDAASQRAFEALMLQVHEPHARALRVLAHAERSAGRPGPRRRRK